MSFYLKYRPQKISELDLASVRESFEKIIKSRKIPHALLLSGPRGTGKTSAARIMAKYLNCEAKEKPCNKCGTCVSITKGQNIDVIEMDAASNRGIDDIRSLRESVSLAPAKSPKKVYIIDEVHMLTLEAANAFLKTLEEPPPHVIFILATTDPQKLPETVRSRLTNIVFRKARPEEITRQLTRIAEGEKLKIKDQEVYGLIAKLADGSFRDAAKILEELALSGRTISQEQVKMIINQRGLLDIDDFMLHLSQRRAGTVILMLEEAIEKGLSVSSFLDALIQRLHRALLKLEGLSGEEIKGIEERDIIKILPLLLQAKEKMRFSPIDQLPLEIAILKWSHYKFKNKAENGESEKMALPQNAADTNPQLDDNSWGQILSRARHKDSRIEALLRASEPLEFDGANLKIAVFYQFHKERLESLNNKIILEEVVGSVLGPSVKVDLFLSERRVAESPKEDALTADIDDDIIKAAKEIFGT